MKIISTILCLLISTTAIAQYHVKAACNPANNGRTNPHWVNNYVILYTLDNWATSNLLMEQHDYVGSDDNGETSYSSYYEYARFNKIQDAIYVAKHFKTEKSLIAYQWRELAKHKHLTNEYREQNKKLCFGCKSVKKSECKDIVIY